MGVQTTQGYRGKLVDKLTGTILDQFSDEDIKVSTNILDLFDLGEIPGTYTQQITLPGTKKNKGCTRFCCNSSRGFKNAHANDQTHHNHGKAKKINALLLLHI